MFWPLVFIPVALYALGFALRGRVGGWLAGETLHGTLWRAGLPRGGLVARPEVRAKPVSA